MKAILIIFSILALSCGSEDIEDEDTSPEDQIGDYPYTEWALVTIDGKRIQTVQDGVKVDGAVTEYGILLDMTEVLIDGVNAQAMLDGGDYAEFPKDILLDDKAIESLQDNLRKEFKDEELRVFFLTGTIGIFEYGPVSGRINIYYRYSPERFIATYKATYHENTTYLFHDSGRYTFNVSVAGFSYGERTECETNGTWSEQDDTLTLIRDDGLIAVFKRRK